MLYKLHSAPCPSPSNLTVPAHNCAVQELSLIIAALPNACRGRRGRRGKLLLEGISGAEQQVLAGVAVAKARRQIGRLCKM